MNKKLKKDKILKNISFSSKLIIGSHFIYYKLKMKFFQNFVMIGMILIKENLMLFDTHCHLNVDAFNEDLDQVIQRAKENQVEKMAIVGFDEATIQKAIQLSQNYPEIYLILGWHPTEAGSYSKAIEERLKTDWLKNEKVVAMGEMGLDYHWMEDPKEIQIGVFKKQIQVAKELKLPISIHNREATEDTYQVLKEVGLGESGGIMHSFNLDLDWMHKFLELGLYISLSGVVTFKNAPEVRQVAQEVPLDRLLIETDAPYLAPTPNRGKRNEPAFVRFVAQELANAKGLSAREIAEQTTKNAKHLFGLD